MLDKLPAFEDIAAHPEQHLRLLSAAFFAVDELAVLAEEEQASAIVHACGACGIYRGEPIAGKSLAFLIGVLKGLASCKEFKNVVAAQLAKPSLHAVRAAALRASPSAPMTQFVSSESSPAYADVPDPIVPEEIERLMKEMEIEP